MIIINLIQINMLSVKGEHVCIFLEKKFIGMKINEILFFFLDLFFDLDFDKYTDK